MRRPGIDTILILLTGLALGGLGAALALWGNPVNSGICISCFMENLAGALKLHGNTRMAAFRPELAGFVVGSLVMALVGGEMRPRSGRLPVLGFFLGVFLIVGSSVFMGCPIKMMLRLGAGDLTAVAATAGLAAGVWVGTRFLRAGLDMGASAPEGRALQGSLVPAFFILVLALALVAPWSFVQSTSGPGSQKAPVALALGSGIAIGALAQRSRFCVTGSFSNLFLARDVGLMRGFVLLLLTALALNGAAGTLRLGMFDQPGSHPDHLWNFLSMALVGLASVLAGGCPFRQLILAGEGAVDASMVVLGMIAAGGLVQQWGIASTSAGPTDAGKAAVLLGMALCLGIFRFHRRPMNGY